MHRHGRGGARNGNKRPIPRPLLPPRVADVLKIRGAKPILSPDLLRSKDNNINENSNLERVHEDDS